VAISSKATLIASLALECKEIDNLSMHSRMIDDLVNKVQAKEAMTSTYLISAIEDVFQDNGLKEEMKRKLGIYLCSDADQITMEMKGQIIANVQQVKSDMAFEIIKRGAYAKSFFAVMQFFNLYGSWKAISTAENVIEETKSNFPEIEENISSLVRETVELSSMMKTYDDITDEAEKSRIAQTVILIADEMDYIYSDTKTLLDDIKVEISGIKVKLDLYADKAAENAFTSVVHGITSIWQYLQLPDIGNRLSILPLSLSFIFFGLAAANTASFVLTREELEKVRECMRDIRELEKKLISTRTIIRNAKFWYRKYSGHTTCH